MSTVNTQVSDSVTETIANVLGNAPAEGFGLLDTVMAETVGMLMHGAVNNQTNAQMIGNATVTATCARMLAVPVPNCGKNPPVTSPSTSPNNPFSPVGSPNSEARKAEDALKALNQEANAQGSNANQAQQTLEALARAARESGPQS